MSVCLFVEGDAEVTSSCRPLRVLRHAYYKIVKIKMLAEGVKDMLTFSALLAIYCILDAALLTQEMGGSNI